MVLADRWITERYISTELGTHSNSSMQSSAMNSRYSKFQIVGSRSSLDLIRSGFGTTCQEKSRYFWRRSGETSLENCAVRHFQPQTKEQLKQWKHPGIPFPKKATSAMPAEKVMASIFGVYKKWYRRITCKRVTLSSRSTALKKLEKTRTIVREADKRGALPPGQRLVVIILVHYCYCD